MVAWSEVSQDEFDQHPTGKRSPKDVAWDQLLQALASGKAIKVPVRPDEDKRSLKLSLGRRAANRGIKLDVREGDGYLLVRKQKASRRTKRAADAGPLEEGSPLEETSLEADMNSVDEAAATPAKRGFSFGSLVNTTRDRSGQ